MSYTLSDVPKNCGYNKVFQHKYCLHVPALPGNLILEMIHKCDYKFGWHFVPHPNMNYNSEDWYENQTAYISFENQLDLINVVLSSNTIGL